MGNFQSLAEAFAYLEAFANFERQTPMREAYRLDRMAALLDRCGNPQLARPAIHIAGSKGKGSTAHYCAAILKKAGYRVGLYASPHLLDWRERICQPDGFFSDNSYLLAIDQIRSLVDDLRVEKTWPHGDPTTFELLTLAAYLVFEREKLDWMVIETGLGGLLDATNLMRPQACVITALELEHTDILGDTIEEIAAQKAGIFKAHAILVALQPQYEPDRVRPVLEASAKVCGGTVWWVESPWMGMDDPNAALAAQVIDRLRLAGLVKAPVSEEEWNELVVRAISDVHLPGRLEWHVSEKKVSRLLLDVAHTPQSVHRALQAFHPERGDVLLFGSVSGKRHREMAEILAPLFEHIIITTPGTFKKSDPEMVWQSFRAINPGVLLVVSPNHAFEQSLAIVTGQAKPAGRILICGSFYLAAAIHSDLIAAGFHPVSKTTQGGNDVAELAGNRSIHQ